MDNFSNRNICIVLFSEPQILRTIVLSVLLSSETGGSVSFPASMTVFSQISASTSVRLRTPPSILTESEVSLSLVGSSDLSLGYIFYFYLFLGG